MSTQNQTLADLVEARDYFKQEAADCRRASESASGDRGWWNQRASKYDRFADAVATRRGLPEDIAYAAATDAFLFISEKYPDAEGSTSLERARQYESHGCKIIERDGKPWMVEHPDWHSHTWLTASELEQAMKSCGYTPSDEYWALLAGMKELESRGNEVRVVIWFDN